MRDERTIQDLLRRLTLAAGAPGAEDEVRAIVRQEVESVGEISYDRLGSILCEKRGDQPSPRVVLDAHMDEVAFMVQSITREGMLKFVPLGGWWPHVVLGQRVDVVTEKGKVPGVTGSKPPHFLSKKERTALMDLDAMYIDVGATSDKQASELGIQLGDTVVPRSSFEAMAPKDILSSKAFDDRVGVGILCETLLHLGGERHPNTVVGVGAVQEEIGCRGAVTASELARPDAGIILEGTPADDTPGFTERQAVLGKGPQIRLYDPTAVSNRKFVRFVKSLAEEKGIDIQLAVRRSGGTDAKSVHLHDSGVPTVVIGVPARYIHCHVSLIHWQDYLAACNLVAELVRRLDQDVVDSFVDYS